MCAVVRVKTEVTGRVATPVTQRQAYGPGLVRRCQAGSAAEAAEASACAANRAFASSILRP